METGRDRVQIQLCEIVNDINKNRANVNDLRFAQPGSPSTVVVVAAHRGNGREFSKLLNDVPVTDVTRMDDQVAAAKNIHRLRT